MDLKLGLTNVFFEENGKKIINDFYFYNENLARLILKHDFANLEQFCKDSAVVDYSSNCFLLHLPLPCAYFVYTERYQCSHDRNIIEQIYLEVFNKKDSKTLKNKIMQAEVLYTIKNISFNNEDNILKYCKDNLGSYKVNPNLKKICSNLCKLLRASYFAAKTCTIQGGNLVFKCILFDEEIALISRMAVAKIDDYINATTEEEAAEAITSIFNTLEYFY